MPRRDETGPRGLGSMTGRGAGYCAGYDVPGYVDNRGMCRALGRSGRDFECGLGRRRGTGLGRGLRRGHGYAPNNQTYNPGINVTTNDKINYLKDEAKGLKNELTNIQNQINNLEANKED